MSLEEEKQGILTDNTFKVLKLFWAMQQNSKNSTCAKAHLYKLDLILSHISENRY